MLSPAKILRVSVCFCVLLAVMPEASAQDKVSRAEEMKNAYEAYVKGIFDRYDENKDGMLDVSERFGMRRPVAVDDAADVDSDGNVSSEELLNSYLNAHRKPTKTGRRKPSDSYSGARKKEAAKKGDQVLVIGGVKVVYDDGKLTLVGNSGDVAKVEKRLRELQQIDEESEAKIDQKKVALSIWLVRSFDEFDAQKLKGLSTKLVASKLSALSKGSAAQIEEFNLEAVIGRSFELKRAAEVPVVQAVTVARGGQTMTQTSNYSVGTQLNANTLRRDNGISIKFTITKSTLEDSDVSLMEFEDKSILAKTIQTFELDADVDCRIGKASVIESVEADRSWTLIFCADEVVAQSSKHD